MGLDISKIKNAELKAYTADKDNNKPLDKEEFSVFKSEAIEKEGLYQAMGLYVTNPSEATAATSVTETKVEKEVMTPKNKTARKAVEDSITKYAKSQKLVPEDLMAALKAEFKNPEYASTLADVEKIVNTVIATDYNSKEDIESIKKEIKKQDKLDKFQEDVLDQVVKMAKTEQVAREANVLVGLYKEAKAEQGENVNFTKLEDAVKNKMEERGLKNESYYSDEAFDELKKYIAGDSKIVHDERIKTTQGETLKDVKEELKSEVAKGDRVATKTINGNKASQNTAARHNRYESNYVNLGQVSEKYLIDELGEKLYEKLNRSYLYEHQNEDRSYNVRSLAEKILYRAGYDYVVNQSKDIEASELRNIQVELKQLTGQDFSEGEVKKLLKLSAIDREKNDRGKALAKALPLGTLPAAIAGFLSSAKLNVTQTVNITMASSEASKIIEDLKSQGITADTVNLTDGQVGIRIRQEVLKDPRALNTLMSAGIGILASAVLALIFGEGKEFEKSCIALADFDFKNERYTDFEQYKKYVKERYPEAKANAIIALAELCKDENGKLDAAKYDSMMKQIAGVGSNMNCAELKGGSLYATDIVTKTEKEEQCEEGEDCNVIITKEKAEDKEITEDLTKIHNTTYGDTWQGLVEAYYPDLIEKCGGLWGKNGAIRALKVALANGDAEVLKKLLNGGNLPQTIKLPSSINGVERQDGTVKKQKVSGNGKSQLKEVGKDEIKVTQIPGTTTYKAIDGCDEKQDPAYGDSKEEAVANLEKQTGKKYKGVIEQ